MCAATLLAASAANAAGDVEKGELLAQTCLGCHAIHGMSTTYPAYRVPKIGGQHPEYLVIALNAYKAGDRGHKTMRAQAASLSDQDMQDLAAYFAQAPARN